MRPAKIRQIFHCFARHLPQPTTELQYQTPFELLVAVVLSAQATDVSVNKATSQLFRVANTPQQLLALGEEGLIPYIRSIGLYKSKARNLISTCQRLVESFNSQVPARRKDLESLPGVGRKTANVILNTVFRQPTIAVDTHIFRVANRMNLAPGRTTREVEDHLLRVVPREFQADAHHWLILHGRYTCTAQRPRCGQCLVREWCEYPYKHTPAQSDR